MMLGIFIGLIFFSTPLLVYIYSFFGTLMALIFVIIDTQMLLNNHKYGIGKDDYIRAALIIYIDFINIFMHLLRLLGKKK
jgi:FtsH-binding integral membrane protein